MRECVGVCVRERKVAHGTPSCPPLPAEGESEGEREKSEGEREKSEGERRLSVCERHSV